MVSALAKRTAVAVAVACCSGVVLGISACIADHNRKQVLFSGEVVLNLLVASLTLVFEGVWALERSRADGWSTGYAVELVAASMLWVLWLAAASAYSAASGHMRVICSDYDQLLAAAKMAGNDDASIAAAKKEFKAGCPRLAALTAFLWLGWIAYTVTLLWTLYVATRPEATWRSSFRYPNERVRGSGESGGEKRFTHADGRRSSSTCTTPRNGSIA